MEFRSGRNKRARQGTSLNGHGGFKKSKQESESFHGVGSKSKPCTKFFSTSGCPFGEGCHFLHYVPGGYKAVAQILNLDPAPAPPPTRNPAAPPSYSDNSPAPAVKTKLCNKYNTAEGCKYGDKCNFAHGEWELGRPAAPSHEDPRAMGGPMFGRMGGRFDHPPQGFGSAAGFGATATAKISIDGSLAGAIIGKGGANTKQICRVTGAKLSVRDHESDPNLKNIELEGSFDQIDQASRLVRELIANVRAGAAAPAAATTGPPVKKSGRSGQANNYKTKLCENFTKGTCTFGDKCHFAHGGGELRKSAM